MGNEWPKTLDEAVKICLLTLTPQEKAEIQSTPEDRFIDFHFNWAMALRNKFGMWQGNEELIESCGEWLADDASMVIVKTVWKELNRNKRDTI